MSHHGWHVLGHELRRRRRPLLKVAAWSLAEALPSIASGALIARALDQGFLAHRPLTGCGYLAAFAVAMLIGALGTRQMFPHLAATVEPLRDQLVHRLVHATLVRSVAGLDGGADTSVSRLTGLAEHTRQLATTLLRTVRPAVFKIIAALAGVATLAPAIALIAMPPLLLALGASVLIMRAIARHQRTLLLTQETIAEEATTVVGALRDVIACAAEPRARARIDQAIDTQVRHTRRMARLTALRTVTMSLGFQLPLLALLAATGWLTRHHALTPGQIMGGLTYISAALVPAVSSLVSTVGSTGLELNVVLKRLSEATTLPDRADLPEMSPQDTSPGSAPAAAPRVLPSPNLKLHALTFAYGPHAKPVVNNLHLHVPHGDHLAIVGPSGIGKSTLAQLLTGTVTADSGEILLAGRSLADIPPCLARSTIALIPQEAYVFAGTLRENLTYLAPDATDADLDASADAVGLRTLAERLGGYDTLLGPEGPQLSSGERQLIALTRVHLSPAPVVILDEATCYLDPAAEARAEQAFATRQGTLIVIAHRITSAQRARRILLFSENGTTLGTHTQLLATSPLYTDLVGHWDTPHTPRPEPATA
ncbi:ATP-binding cassette domain-containing protein [Streptomyces griseochromogenes]|uniref:ATP-binding cassette domain-containing protein n=1 Tax=Streptomyces griseochromogenes TaxID=68214 RepID=UPI0037929F09